MHLFTLQCQVFIKVLLPIIVWSLYSAGWLSVTSCWGSRCPRCSSASASDSNWILLALVKFNYQMSNFYYSLTYPFQESVTKHPTCQGHPQQEDYSLWKRHSGLTLFVSSFQFPVGTLPKILLLMWQKADAKMIVEPVSLSVFSAAPVSRTPEDPLGQHLTDSDQHLCQSLTKCSLCIVSSLRQQNHRALNP